MKIIKHRCPVCYKEVDMEVLRGSDGYGGMKESLRPLRHVNPATRKRCEGRKWVMPKPPASETTADYDRSPPSWFIRLQQAVKRNSGLRISHKEAKNLLELLEHLEDDNPMPFEVVDER